MTPEDQAFKWLTEKGYPTAVMSQLQGFTTLFLAPILAEYAAFLNNQPLCVTKENE